VSLRNVHSPFSLDGAEQAFAYLGGDRGTSALGAADRCDERGDRRALAVLGTSRTRPVVVGLGVLDPGDLRPPRAQGCHRAGVEPAPAGGTAGLRQRAAAHPRPRWQDPASVNRPKSDQAGQAAAIKAQFP
jgi:hypothetical protein